MARVAGLQGWPGNRGKAAGLATVWLVVLAASLLLVGPPARAASTDATTTLAQRYAPIVVVREQAENCGVGEAFRPTPVTTVLGQQDVVLRGPNGAQVTAPTAADLAGKGTDWYLDYPGNPLDPNCDYENWFRNASAGSQPTLYSRVATDPAYPDKIALQYWFFYTFNDWNDKHEGDWEMVQVVFPAATAEQALTVTPESVAYAQHEGSQVSPWDGGDLIKVGDHPVVYPGQGSHAAYYTQAKWFGKSSSAGFGCDNTTAPGVEVQPQIQVIPAGAPPTSGPFAWVSYTGHWGQQEPSFNNGPTGPVTKTQWSAPISWQVEEGRTSAVALPPVPGIALSQFCKVTTAGSLLFIELLDSPLMVAGTLLVLLVLAVFLISRTDWRRPRSDDPDRQRRAGQIVTGAFGWVRRHLLPVAGISAVVAIVLLAAQTIRGLLFFPRESGQITDVYGATGRIPATIGSAVVGLVLLVLLGWVAASVMTLVGDDATGGTVRARTALRTGRRQRSAIWAVIVLALLVGLMTGSVILLPLAAWLASRWAVAPVAAVLEGLPPRAAFARSTALTRGHRWRTLIVAAMLAYIGLAVPGMLGAILLLATGWPMFVSGLISVVALALLLPVACTGLTLQFYDLRQRSGQVAAQAASEPIPAA